MPFTATYMKGRANYLCLHRLDQLNEARRPGRSHDVFLPIIRDWSARTDTGDRAELAGSARGPAVLERGVGDGRNLPRHRVPALRRLLRDAMRQRAAASDVVIVNHHLLCADAAVRQSAYGEVIPACTQRDRRRGAPARRRRDAVLRVRRQHLPGRGSRARRRAARRVGALSARDDAHEIEKALDRLRDRARAFFSDLAYRATDRATGRAAKSGCARREASLSGARRQRRRAHRRARHPRSLACARGQAGAAAGRRRMKPERRARGPDARNSPRSPGARRRSATSCGFCCAPATPTYVYFVEFRGQGVFLRASPIDVSAIVRELLLDRMRTTVLTSATLTVDGTFEYIRSRLGIRRADRGPPALRSSTSRRRRSCICRRGCPTRVRADFAIAAGRAGRRDPEAHAGPRVRPVHELRDAAGRCTAIAEMALDYPMFVQGTAPRTRAAAAVPRDAARGAVRDVELLAGRRRRRRSVELRHHRQAAVRLARRPDYGGADRRHPRAGGEPFGEYQVPLAILALQQGLGRLIRHRQDRGVLAVLDPRLRTKGYGRRFIIRCRRRPSSTTWTRSKRSSQSCKIFVIC